MDFIKKHYEKVILSAVLLGVVGFLIFLPILIHNDAQALTDAGTDATTPKKVESLPPLDMSRQMGILERMKTKVTFDLSTTNRLFNPLEWKKAPDGTLFPIKNGNETSAGAAIVTKITPLYFTISFESVETNGLAPRYVIGVENQAADRPALRRKQPHYVSAGEKKEFFTLASVKGDPADPSALVLKLTDTGDTVTISKEKPYQRVQAYAADLKYDLDKPVRNFSGIREGWHLSFGGEDYIIVGVDANEVILSAQSNQKKTTLPYAR